MQQFPFHGPFTDSSSVKEALPRYRVWICCYTQSVPWTLFFSSKSRILPSPWNGTFEWPDIIGFSGVQSCSLAFLISKPIDSTAVEVHWNAGRVQKESYKQTNFGSDMYQFLDIVTCSFGCGSLEVLVPSLLIAVKNPFYLKVFWILLGDILENIYIF